MARLRHASSIVITRGSLESPEIFLVQRNPKLKFMGGFWAFPGGTLDERDISDPENIDLDAYIRAGMRELFEETGILTDAVGDTVASETLSNIRNLLLDRDGSNDSWYELITDHEISQSSLKPICMITTPPFSPVIYKTQFLHIHLTTDQIPEIIEGELVDGRFFNPADATAAWDRGENHIAPPNLFLLRLMAENNFDAFKSKAKIETEKFEQGHLHPVYFSPGIFMAPLKTPTLPPATTTNTLIVGTDKLYVVEPATYDEDEQATLFRKMDELIEEGKSFEAILLTHYHMDHVGAVTAVSQRYQLPVRAHPDTYDKIPEGYIKGEPLNEGDRIELGTAPDGSADWHLDVLHTPGHTPDHIVYLESRYHAAIIGDMMSTASTILIAPPEGHMRTYLDSLEKLLDYPIKTVFPSHGTVHNDGHALIKYFQKHRKGREDKVINALSSEPKSIADLMPAVYDDIHEKAKTIAEQSLHAILIKLEEENICQQSNNCWQII
jgi:glyoxylase-like metal-dependent hydrolase (beta-lactamase superfamily II)/8-oxo-dGTP pyrophosphatase MutT (NUDIX family)